LSQFALRGIRLVALIAAAVLAAGGSAAAAAPGHPGSSRANPIIAIGPPSTPAPVFVDIFWSDGTEETVPAAIPGPPSRELAAYTMRQRGLAEERLSPSPRRLAAQDTAGGSACSWTIQAPYKITSTRAATNSTVQCTRDVVWIGGTLYLLRSAALTVIGADTEAGGSASEPRNTMFWYTDGECLTSTWQYSTRLDYTFQTAANLTKTSSHIGQTVWITC
jgi:hypothetical protein